MPPNAKRVLCWRQSPPAGGVSRPEIRDASDDENLRKMLQELHGVPAAKRTARYRSVIVFISGPDDPSPLVGEGVWEGSIGESPRGSGGFGYDPIFIPRGQTQTAAEMTSDLRNRLCHRGQAARAFLAQFGARA